MKSSSAFGRRTVWCESYGSNQPKFPANYPLVCDLLSVTRWAARRCFFLASRAAARLSALREGRAGDVDLVAVLLSEISSCAVSLSGICMVFSDGLTVSRYFEG